MNHLFRSLSSCVAVSLLMVATAIGQPSDFGNTQFAPKTGLPPFEYTEAPDRLPNYTPGASWGTQGEPIRTMQKPLSPEDSMAHFVTFPEFDIHPFTAEPNIIKPLWLAFDHRGRLWIAESVDYPNQLQPEGMGRDRLKIVEDTDGDGLADKFTVFADKLSVPTSFVFAEGGVMVVHSGRIELLRDTDGDDVADERRVIMEGWGTNDTHATVSNLRYGFDNWIWGVVGYSGFNGTVGGEELRFGQGIFRFKPDGSKLEFLRSSNNNTWGLDFTEDNIVIGSTANDNASMYMPMPNRYYEAVNGWSAARLESIATSQAIFPITENVRQVDWHGRYTAGSGSAIYTARSFPKAFWNRAQFVAEPTGHLLGLFFLERNGADFIAHNSRNMLASDDEWSSPIYGEVGPDGALWVVDWYNYIIQHNPTPRGFETGRGNAYDTPLRDKTHGRIYRLTHRGGAPTKPVTLDASDPKSLVEGLKSDNKLWRLHAQRLLVESGDTDVVSQLAALVRDRSVDELGLNPAAIHALWTMDGLGVLDGGDSAADEIAQGALDHSSAGVRRAAVMVLPRNEDSLEAILDNRLLRDVDAQVRMATFLALSELPPLRYAHASIIEALNKSENFEDHWMVDAATAAAAKNDAGFIQVFLSLARLRERLDSLPDETRDGALLRVIRIVTTHYAQRGPTESVVSVLKSLGKTPTSAATVVLDGLTQGWPDAVKPELSDPEKQQLEAVMDELPDSVRDRLLSLASRWNVPGLFAGRLESVVASLKGQVADVGADDASRAAAAGRWINLQDQADVAEAILNEISLLSSPELAGGLLASLGVSTDIGTAEAILERWSMFTPAVRRAAIGVLLRRPEWSLVLLDAVHDSSISRTDIPPEYWSQLRRNPNRRVAGYADRIANASAAISSDRAEIVERLLPLARERGDAARGKIVYDAYCAICHKFNGHGGAVGPDLTGIESRPREDVLLEILDPNRSVEANYRLWNVTTTDGTTYSGRMESESQTTVEILDVAAQKYVIQRKDIETLQASEQSIMPIGFEAIPAEDLTALLEYLATPHHD